MATQEQLQAIRNYAQSLNGDERANFISKFESIKGDDNKVSTLASRISSKAQPIKQENKGFKDPFFIPKLQMDVTRGALNTATAGGSEFLLNKIGLKSPDSIGYKAGNIGGYAVPVAGARALIGKVAPLAGRGIAKTIARGGIEGALAGAYGTPSDRTGGAVGGGILGAIGSLFPKVINFGGTKTQQKLAEKATSGIDKIGDDLSMKYDQLFSNIKNGSAKVGDLADSIDDVVRQYPEGQGMDKLIKISKRLKKANNISAQELHNLKQEVRTLIPRSVWKGQSDANAIQNAQRDLYFRITEKLESLGGKEYSGLSQEYKKFKGFEQLANRVFYKNGVPSNANVLNKIDEPTRKAVRELSSQLPQAEQFFDDFLALRRGGSVKRFLKNPINDAAIIGAGALIHQSRK